VEITESAGGLGQSELQAAQRQQKEILSPLGTTYLEDTINVFDCREQSVLHDTVKGLNFKSVSVAFPAI